MPHEDTIVCGKASDDECRVGYEEMLIKLLFDAMWAGSWVPAALGDRCFDVELIFDANSPLARNDGAILEYAAKEGRVVVTCNYSDRRRESNFVLLDEDWDKNHPESHAGILLVLDRDRVRYEQDVLDRMLRFLNEYDREQMQTTRCCYLPRY
jgi:hypothetical protein